MIRLFTLLSLACLLSVPALGFESAPVSTKRTVATLITDSDSVVPGGRVRIALRLRLTDGWHTYWHNPGEAGVPTEINAALSPGASVGAIDWPSPGRITEGPVTTYGFFGRGHPAVQRDVGPGHRRRFWGGDGTLAGLQRHLCSGRGLVSVGSRGRNRRPVSPDAIVQGA